MGNGYEAVEMVLLVVVVVVMMVMREKELRRMKVLSATDGRVPHALLQPTHRPNPNIGTSSRAPTAFSQPLPITRGRVVELPLACPFPLVSMVAEPPFLCCWPATYNIDNLGTRRNMTSRSGHVIALVVTFVSITPVPIALIPSP